MLRRTSRHTTQLPVHLLPGLSANGPVYTLVADGTTIYAGGAFTQFNGTAAGLIAAFNTVGTRLTSFKLSLSDPQPQYAVVNAIAVQGTNLVAVGHFYVVTDGTTNTYRLGIVQANKTTGAPTSLDIRSQTVTSDSWRFRPPVHLVGGYFNASVGSKSGANLVGLAPDGTLKFNPANRMNNLAFHLDGNTLWIGEHVGTANPYPYPAEVVSLDTTTDTFGPSFVPTDAKTQWVPLAIAPTGAKSTRLAERMCSIR